MMKLLALALCCLFAAVPSQAAPAEPSSLDELLAVPISAASKLEQMTMRAPASVTVLTAEEIARFGWRTLAEALGSVPGLYVTYDRNYSYLGVRGFSRPTDYNNRVLVMIDGLRLNEDVFGYAAIGTDLPLDMRAVERIEIVRGPGSVAFGGSAMLAVVNVILRDPQNTTDRAMAVEAGDFGRAAVSLRGVTRHGRKLRIAWSAIATESEGQDLFYPEYATEEPGSGEAHGADWDRGRGIAVRAVYGAFDLTGYGSQRAKGIPTGAYGIDLGDRRATTRDGWTMAGLGWGRELAHGWSLRARVNAGKYSYDAVYPSADSLYLDSTDNNWWGTELQATWAPRPASRTTAGIEWRDNQRAEYRSFDDRGNVYFDDSLPHRIAALYAEHEQQLSERLLLTVGARYDDYSHSAGALSPRLALVYLPNRDNSLKLLAGRAFRAPNVYELADGVAGFEHGTRLSLEPETIESVEVGWDRRLSPSLLGSISAFHHRMIDLIDQRVGSDGVVHYVNVAEAISLGAQMELSARLPSGLWVVGSASLQRAEDDAGERLSNSPELQLKLKLSAPLSSQWRSAVELQYESGRGTVVSTMTDPFLVANATVSWTSPARPWTLELQARNLFDRDYALPGGLEHLQPAIEQDGRSLTLRLEARF